MLLAAYAASAGEPEQGEEGFTADNFISAEGGNVLIGLGHVVVKKGDVELRADSFVAWLKDQEVYVEGDVTIVHGSVRSFAPKAYYNWARERALIVEGKVSAPGPEDTGFVFLADKLKQVAPGRFVARESSFTNCGYHRPHQHFTASFIDLVADKRITAYNVVYYVRDIPVFYFPYVTRSLEEDSAWISVQAGKSSNFGHFVLTDTRFDLSEGVDLKFDLDYLSKRGLGRGVTVRYNLSPGLKGQLDGYQINSDHGEDEGDIEPDERNRWRIKYVHQQDFPENWEIDLEYQKFHDPGFYEEYYEDEFKEDKPVETYAYAKHSRDNLAFTFLGKIRVNDWMEQTEYLPQVGLHLFSQPIFGSLLLLSSDTQIARARKRYDDESVDQLTPDQLLSRNRGMTRVDSYNEVSCPLDVGFLNLEPFVGMRQSWYEELLDTHADATRGQFVYGVRAAAQFHRTFNVRSRRFDVNGLRHVITPEITYLSLQDPTVSAGRLVQFDEVDTVAARDQVTLALRNRFQTRREGQVTDVIDLDVSIDAFPNAQRDNGGEDFSNLRTDLRINPAQGVYFFLDTEYSIANSGHASSGDFEIANTGLSFDVSDDWSFFVGNRYEKEVSSTSTVAFDRVLNEKWTLGVAYEYDWRSKKMRDLRISLWRDFHGWIAELSYEKDEGENDDYFAIFLEPKGLSSKRDRLRFVRRVSERLTSPYWERDLY